MVNPEGISRAENSPPISFTQSNRKMKTYTLTKNELYYLTEWNTIGKKSKTIYTTLLGVLVTLMQQAIFSMPTEPISLGILYVGIPSSLIFCIFYFFEARSSEKASGTVVQIIENETRHYDERTKFE